MWKAVARFYFRIFRWTVTGSKPPVKKFIIIVLPHTSKYDFVLGKCYGILWGIKSKVLIKKEGFRFPLGLLLRALGGIPVDRSNNRWLAEQMVEQFNRNAEFGLTITPEGTRGKVRRIKRGFYYIAQSTNVPVYMGFIDYRTRRLGIGPEFLITGDFSKDIVQIIKFYAGMEGLYKGRFDSSILT